MASSSGKDRHLNSQMFRFMEKGSKNKRKFTTETSVGDSSRPQSSANDSVSCEFSTEKLDDMSCHGQSNACELHDIYQEFFDTLKLDLGLSTALDSCKLPTSEDVVEGGSNCVDWNDVAENQLRELVLQSLDAVFKTAIKHTVSCGYTEEDVTKAVLSSGLTFGSNDIHSNIVDTDSAYLIGGQDNDGLHECTFVDLEQLERVFLARLVSFVRYFRPSLSVGNALWCLLICEINVPNACAMECGPLKTGISDTASTSNSSFPHACKLDHKTPGVTPQDPGKPIPLAHCSHPGVPPVALSPNMTDPKGENFIPSFGTVDQMFGALETPQIPLKTAKKVHSGSGKRDCSLRQKAQHQGKNFRMCGSKGASRTGKHGNLGGVLSDKKLKAVSGSASTNAKNASLKPSTRRGFSKLPNRSIREGSSIAGPCFVSIPAPASLGGDNKLKLSSPAKRDASLPVTCNHCCCGGIYADMYSDESILDESRDESIQKLFSRVLELKDQFDEWTNWVNQKVIQVTHRLSKEDTELKALRHEREEIERLKKEKVALQESTMKRLSEMENALCKASSQVEHANYSVDRLQKENAALRVEMEAAKLQAAESADRCQDMQKREKTALTMIKPWEKEKCLLQEELSDEKRKHSQAQTELRKAREVQNKLQDRRKQGEVARQEVVDKVSLLSKEMEQIEISAKSEQDKLMSESEKKLHKYKCEIQKLENEISQLRSKADSLKIAALKRGISGNGISKLTVAKSRKGVRHKRSLPCQMPQACAVPDGACGEGGVKRERECVMCLSEEMSVVFLPCAHQVVCNKCNEHHENKGMTDCPSCRSPIQQRIPVRFAHP